jgi:hypothetical protein
VRAGDFDVLIRAKVNPNIATDVPAINVRTTFVLKPRIIFGRTSTPYAQAKKVSESNFHPGEVTTNKARVPRTKTLERLAMRAFFRFRFLRAALREISWALGAHSPPKS